MNFTKDFFNLLLDFGDEWVITNIESNHKDQEVYLDVEYISDYYEDPLNLTAAKLYDHTETRVWRHLDILHYKCCEMSHTSCTMFRRKGKANIGWVGR